jgi:hypothetical protein
VSAPLRFSCRIASIQPPPGHAFDRGELVAAIEAELALLLADDSGGIAESRPLAGGDVEAAVPLSAGAAGRAVARYIAGRLHAPGGVR